MGESTPGESIWTRGTMDASESKPEITRAGDIPPLSGRSVTSTKGYYESAIPESPKVEDPLRAKDFKFPTNVETDAMREWRKAHDISIGANEKTDSENAARANGQEPEAKKGDTLDDSQPVYFKLSKDEEFPSASAEANNKIEAAPRNYQEEVLRMVQRGEVAAELFDKTALPFILSGKAEIVQMPGGAVDQIVLVSTRDKKPIRVVGYAAKSIKSARAA